MADIKITDLPVLAALADDDVFEVVDVSDQTDSPEGSSAQATREALLDGIPRVTASDPSTGQLQINGVEMGNTGWRNMIGFGNVASNSGIVRIRRVGYDVHLWLGANVILSISALAGEWMEMFPLDPGFAPPSETLELLQVANAGSPRTIRALTNSCQYMFRSNADYPAGGSLHTGTNMAKWFTNGPWPTTLPGVPVVD